MSLNASIYLTAALAAMACALPGVWLVLRRQSMLGDALSHAALPGIVIAFLTANALRSAGWLAPETYAAGEHLLLLLGAVCAGVATGWLTEWVQKQGGVDANAALGVVFTGLFALGLFLVRLTVDDVHLDADCILFGRVVEVALDTVPLFGTEVPRGAIVSGAALVVNLVLTLFCFKELRIAAFDPELATVQGINARAVHYAHLAVTAVTAVAVFEIVGSILVVALLVVPTATAQLLTDRLKPLIVLSLLLAAAAALLGHWLSQTLPELIFPRLGLPGVEDVSTSGMIAVTAGMLFVIAWVCAPRHGLLAASLQRWRLSWRILMEDLLGALYRQHEQRPDQPLPVSALYDLARTTPGGRRTSRLILRWMQWRRMIACDAKGCVLTSRGLATARRVVRGHRLWETYLDRHFALPVDHLDSSAHLAEHFLDDALREQLASELHTPHADPHGSEIPEPGQD